MNLSSRLLSLLFVPALMLGTAGCIYPGKARSEADFRQRLVASHDTLESQLVETVTFRTESGERRYRVFAVVPPAEGVRPLWEVHWAD